MPVMFLIGCSSHDAPPRTGATTPQIASIALTTSSISVTPDSVQSSPSAAISAKEAKEAEEVEQAEQAHPDEPTLTPYSLDTVSREIAPRGRVRCPKVELVRYRGDVIRYHKPVNVYVEFRDHLRRFEEIVRDTAIEFYGRPPRRIRHLGTYYCRRIRAWPTLISEHGLGNAIDVEGFEFARISKRKAATIPAKLRRSLSVRLEKHWNGSRGVAATHSRFLHTLAQRLIDEPDLFRVMLGPAEPGHQDHFHLDLAPWRIVNIFEDVSTDPVL